MSVGRVVGDLCRAPVRPADARLPPASGGLPEAAGFYAWWIDRQEALPAVPVSSVAGREEWLLYIGIAPGRASSKQTVRTRVLGNHLGGNLGSSTFRLTLAALLWEAEGWKPQWPKDRVLLSAADNAALSAWQQRHLRLTWAEHPTPFDDRIENAVISELRPPLNLAANASHPFHTTLGQARAALRAAANAR